MKTMKTRLATLLMAILVGTLGMAGCGNQNGAPESVGTEDRDKKAADEVAALIDAIYVQKRTDETDTQCKAAKDAWDSLTDVQKGLVAGENADPDYFGRDTGDASKDNPLNQDGIGENEILAVSFGTSYNDSRVADIKGIEDALQTAYPDWSVRRAFTAQIIINHVQARDGEYIDNVEQALERAVSNKVKNLVIQPTHLMHGAEYDELMEAVDAYKDKFESVKVAEPLLGQVGKDEAEVNEDKKIVAKSLAGEAVKEAGYDSVEAAKADGAAFVFLGHGRSHAAKVSYSQMQAQMAKLGYENVFVGTVEGEPEETSCEAVIEAAAKAGYKKVILRPLMVVAGDHANNDMAGEGEDSWAGMFKASGKFESVESQIYGLGQVKAIQQIYVEHTGTVMAQAGENEADTPADKKTELADGEYSVDFKTDNSMFRVNEAYGGKGKLTVKNGEMTVHISLGSKNIVNLYPGFASDAQKDGAKLLMPTVDSVTYSDGYQEEVYGFDVPVPAVGKEFDLALIGTKGKWYDHKASVSNPEPFHGEKAEDLEKWKDGSYTVELSFEGGSGKAKILSPAAIVVSQGKMTALVEWSSPNYDYMIVDGKKYMPVNAEGNSAFEIPVSIFDEPFHVIGDTVAMSTPHEVEYTLTLHSGTMKAK